MTAQQTDTRRWKSARTGNRAQRMSFFDGLRGVAALGVVLSHLFQHFYPPIHSPQPEDPISRVIGSTRSAHSTTGSSASGSSSAQRACAFRVGDRERFALGTIVRRYVRLTLPILASRS